MRTVNYFNGIRETLKQAGLATMDRHTAASVAPRRVRKMSDASRPHAVRLAGTQPSPPRPPLLHTRPCHP